MGRFIVLFLIISAVVLFLIILDTPPQMIQQSYLYQKYVASAGKAKEPEEEAAPAQKPASRRRATATARTTRPMEVLSASETTEAVASEPLSPPQIELGPSESQASEEVTAITDRAAMYSSNSPTATVLKVLNEGDVVEVDLEFITSGGRWALVTVPDEKISGFVRSDGLQLTKTDEGRLVGTPVGTR